jgi:hypothetical protein
MKSSEGFQLPNYPNDTASTGTADISRYYAKTLPNIIYNNDPSMNLAELTRTTNPRTLDSKSVLDNDWKKNININSNNTLLSQQAACENVGARDQFAHLSSLESTVDTSSRLRCGWVYNRENYTRGRGALGINKGPIKTTASGTWMWDLKEAKKKYHTEICSGITNCGDIGASKSTADVSSQIDRLIFAIFLKDRCEVVRCIPT